MGKKQDEGGAPAYMGLFTSLMTVLLAFFILLVAMADTQDAGFYHGVGSVQNSLGITGGFGMMPFAKAAGDRGVLGVDKSEQSDEQKQRMMHVEGERGLGTVDIDDIESVNNGYYITVFIPHTFKKGLSTIDRGSALESYLQKMSIGFLSIKDKILVRSYAEDAQSKEDNLKLATRRSQAIINMIHQNGIEYERLSGAGYSYDRYFDFSEVEKQIRQAGQASYFYIFRKKTE